MTLRDEILAALGKLGVKCAGTFGDTRRWSAGDLATDLAAELAGMDRLRVVRDEALEGAATELDGWVGRCRENGWRDVDAGLLGRLAAHFRSLKSQPPKEQR